MGTNNSLIHVTEEEKIDSVTKKPVYMLKGKLPSITPLDKIRYTVSRINSRGYRSWGADARALFNKEALQFLKKQRIVALKDLEGWDKPRLCKVPGIGEIGAYRILKCLKHSNVKHRGVGYPWELHLTVQVPTANVELLYTFDQNDVEEAFAHHVGQSMAAFPAVQKVLLAKRRADLESQEMRLAADLKALKRQIVEVAAEAAER